MFIVNTTSPLDEEWEERDKVIYQKAGRKSDGSGATRDTRSHTWRVVSFAEAHAIKLALESLPKVNVIIRER